MASWKRFYTQPLINQIPSNKPPVAYANNASSLKEVYTGPTNRMERYAQYDKLDSDPLISAALDVIAEFCTQENRNSRLPFIVTFNDESDEAEVKVLKKTLQKWSYINQWRERMFYIWRNTLKYGDIFFIRDPETYELLYVDPRNVEKVYVDENNNKEIYSYAIRGISVNLVNKIFTQDQNTMMQSGSIYQASNISPGSNMTPGKSFEVPAKHVVHLSLNSTGLDFVSWPFGQSILETIYKPAQQKELLENAYLIYKIRMAPDRRIVYVDVGDSKPNVAMSHVMRIKNEFEQRRMPSRVGGSNSVVDSGYDPQSVNEWFYIPTNSEGKGVKIETLPGGGDLSSGDNDLLDYFNNSIMTGLGIPKSYIPTAVQSSDTVYNDGKVGVALLQEFRFAQMCKRIQGLLRGTLDFEFKLFCKKCGVTVFASDFDLELEEPQSFSDYRQLEKDQSRLSVLQSALAIPYLSKRFAMKTFGQMTEEEIIENEILWAEEHKAELAGKVASLELNNNEDVTLANVGIKRPTSEETGEDNES